MCVCVCVCVCEQRIIFYQTLPCIGIFKSYRKISATEGPLSKY